MNSRKKMKKFLILIVSIFLVCVLNSDSNSDPLGGIDELILDTMKSNRDVDTIKENNNKRRPRQNTRQESTRKIYKGSLQTVGIDNYCAVFHMPESWFVYKKTIQDVYVMNNSRSSRIVVSVDNTKGMNTHDICYGFMQKYIKNAKLISLTQKYCSFEGENMEYNNKVNVEFFNDGKYCTSVIIVGDIKAGKEITRDVKRGISK